MSEELLRIVISTDNHLGFGEKYALRSNDSFASFEEVFITARKERADFVLLAGDLFHENHPSRRTMHSTLEILRKYCYGENPVFLEIMNDQSKILKSNKGVVNFLDCYQSVDLPIFSIHGNHDDPTRDGIGGESLAALDLLSVSNVVNYFGKSERVDDIEIVPILMRKGDCYLALYGLGAIRDERLNRMWSLGRVKFLRPEGERDKFFNIFVVHQNRDLGRGKKNCLKETMIPEWMDLVIWGNEHECHPCLQESLVGTFRIFQPGSSIATSLNESESSLHKKHFGLLSIRANKDFMLKPIPYKSIRPFIFKDISLDDSINLSPSDPQIEERLKELFSEKVNEMIIEASSSVREVIDSMSVDSLFRIQDPDKVLVRLRVDPGKFPTVHRSRFAAEYVGKVANPSDILQFSRKRKNGVNRSDFIIDNDILHDGDVVTIESLLNESLLGKSERMTILSGKELNEALEDFVKNRSSGAFDTQIEARLLRVKNDILNREISVENEDALRESCAALRVQYELESAQDGVDHANRGFSSGRSSSEYQDTTGAQSSQNRLAKRKSSSSSVSSTATSGAKSSRATKLAETKAKTKASTAPKKKNTRAKRANYYDDDDEDEEDEEDEEVEEIEDYDNIIMNVDDESDHVIDSYSDDDSEEIHVPVKGKKKATKTTKVSKASSSTTSSARSSRKNASSNHQPPSMSTSSSVDIVRPSQNSQLSQNTQARSRLMPPSLANPMKFHK